MAEDTSATDGQTKDGATPDEQNPDAQAAGGQPEGGGSESQSLGAEGQKALDAFKSRARTAERDLKKTQERLKELEDKDKSELERAQSRVTELEAETAGHGDTVQSLRVKIAVMEHAAKVGITDLDAATKLLDKDQIEYDDDGQPKNVDALLTKLVAEKPYLTIGNPQQPVGTGNGGEGEGGGGRSFNDLLRQSA